MQLNYALVCVQPKDVVSSINAKNLYLMSVLYTKSIRIIFMLVYIQYKNNSDAIWNPLILILK